MQHTMSIDSPPAGISRRVSSVLAVFSLFLLGACQSIHVDSSLERPVALQASDTYAWSDEENDTWHTPLGRAIRSAIEVELAGLGVRRVGQFDDAGMLVSFQTDVETRVRMGDPYFVYEAAGAYEFGTLSVELANAKTGETVWSGSGRSALRRSAALEHLHSARLVPTDAKPDWRVERKVGAIFAQLRQDLAGTDL